MFLGNGGTGIEKMADAGTPIQSPSAFIAV
jgi:hypothetical protein